MDDTEMDIVLRAVDDASDTFKAVQESAESMGDGLENSADEASDTFEQVTEAAESMGDSLENSTVEGINGLEDLANGAEDSAAGLDDVAGGAEDAGYSMQELIEYCQNMYGGKIEEVAKSTEEVKEKGDEASDSFSNLSAILDALAGAEIFNQLADALWDCADKAGTFEDSLMRARLEAEGAGIDVNAMTDAVSELSATTGRAGGEIRESFIKATARGITDLDSFKQMMTGAGSQATLFGTNIGTMADKMSGLAMRSKVMEKTLGNTGITVEELGEALGIQGATIDDINEKWETMDANQRAAALGMAASMNEGQTANEEYKKSWAGLQAQIDIAKGRLERLAGEVLLPVLVPALEVAARVLNWLGDTISAVMKGPLGGLISIIGSAVAGFALLVPAVMAIKGAMGLYTASLAPAISATWALLSPWLPFIAIGAAIVLIIYEIGKAFGWWTDVSSMLDAIWAGIQRLWSAFINHPDVQAFINNLKLAWSNLQIALTPVINAVLKFFNVQQGGEFDIVRALIDSVSKAWDAMTLPIRTVINIIKLVILKYVEMRTRAFFEINKIKQLFARLPGAIRGAISTLKSVITKPFTDAKTSIDSTVGNIIKKAKSITNISLSGLKKKLTKPFTDAYESIAKTIGSIKKKAESLTGINLSSLTGGFSGGEDLEFYGGSDLTSYSTEKLSVDMNQNINLSLDLRNVPPSMDERTLAGLINETLDSKEFINRLVNNPDFQSLDNKVKQRIVLKSNRANGRGV